MPLLTIVMLYEPDFLILNSFDTIPPREPATPLEPDDTLQDPLIVSGPPEHLAACSLVLSAVGISHRHDHRQNGLTVAAKSVHAAQYHLGKYFAENKGWPVRPPPPPKFNTTGNPPTILIIGSLVLFYLVTGPWQDNNIWFTAGAVNSEAILAQGEWWRLITALTLHADQVHLLGNCIIGGFIVHLLNRTVGYGLGLFLLLGSGTLGNLLNIVARDEVHLSVGFSTSIFAAIGIFSGMQVLSGHKLQLKNILMPIGAGVGLLAMLGVSGERTDLGAHFFGFLCGIAAGIITGRLNIEQIAANTKMQLVFFLVTITVIQVSWRLALP